MIRGGERNVCSSIFAGAGTEYARKSAKYFTNGLQRIVKIIRGTIFTYESDLSCTDHNSQHRRQKATEKLPQLGQDIRRLTRLAYPTASADVCETLAAKKCFIDSLSSFDIRLRIKQARPEHLNDRIRHAEELNGFIGAERTKHHDAKYAREVGSEQPASETGSGYLEEVV